MSNKSIDLFDIPSDPKKKAGTEDFSRPIGGQCSIFDSDFAESAKEAEEYTETHVVPPVLKSEPESEEVLIASLEEDVLTEKQAEKDKDEEDLEFVPPVSPFNGSDKGDLEKRLRKYSDIKNTPVLENYETPYLYHGKNSDHVRYRLSLPNQNSGKKARILHEILDMLLYVAIAFVLALFLRRFVFFLAKVEGPSMQPTLYQNERLFVTRFTYKLHEPEHGDIIICKFDTPLYPDYYVKRIIALEGETVRVTDGVVYVNGTALTEPYIMAPPNNDMEELTVPEDCVFVMGDNRNNSMDSRRSIVGPIRKDLILGKAQFMVFPRIESLEDKT